MNLPQRIEFFRELIHACYPAAIWIYDNQGNLLETDGTDPHLQALLEKGGILANIYNEEQHRPCIAGSFLGVLAGAVFEESEEDEPHLYVIGPVLHTDISSETLEQTAVRLFEKRSDQKEFFAMIDQIPIVPMQMLQNLVLMLHRCVNGETLSLSDICYIDENSSIQPETKNVKKKDRRKTYMAEQRLLYHVREGDMNYQKAHSAASALSQGVRATGREPTMQAALSCIIFTTLCTRAAIEGGLLADTAYTVGDAYIQAMLNSGNIADIRAMNRRMYEDFIQRVHAVKENQKLSKPIRDCCDYIRMHAEDRLSIKTLSSLFGYSEYYLSRKFKNETGEQITDFINRTKTERAKMLLETTDESISDIAETLQFCSSTHFSTVFRKYTGILPNEYRKDHQT